MIRLGVIVVPKKTLKCFTALKTAPKGGDCPCKELRLVMVGTSLDRLYTTPPQQLHVLPFLSFSVPAGWYMASIDLSDYYLHFHVTRILFCGSASAWTARCTRSLQRFLVSRFQPTSLPRPHWRSQNSFTSFSLQVLSWSGSTISLWLPHPGRFSQVGVKPMNLLQQVRFINFIKRKGIKTQNTNRALIKLSRNSHREIPGCTP